jgi:signal recognition particle subunit SRP72
MVGREKEAQSIYTAALKQKPDDIGLVAIASNNMVAINKDQNVFDSKKKMKNATLEGLEHKLTSRQRRNIALNHCLLTHYTNQGEQCQQMCDKLVATYPDMEAEAALIRAVQLAKDGKAREAASLLDRESKQDQEQRLAMKLAAVQLLLTEVSNCSFCNTVLDCVVHWTKLLLLILQWFMLIRGIFCLKSYWTLNYRKLLVLFPFLNVINLK